MLSSVPGRYKSFKLGDKYLHRHVYTYKKREDVIIYRGEQKLMLNLPSYNNQKVITTILGSSGSIYNYA